MKRINFDRKQQRQLRHARIFNKIKEIDNNRPRLVVTKSNAHIVVQLMEAESNRTIASSSSIQLKLKNGNKENAAIVGKDIAEKALKLGVKEVVFDRGGAQYHGRIVALADAMRESGLEF